MIYLVNTKTKRIMELVNEGYMLQKHEAIATIDERREVTVIRTADGVPHDLIKMRLRDAQREGRIASGISLSSTQKMGANKQRIGTPHAEPHARTLACHAPPRCTPESFLAVGEFPHDDPPGLNFYDTKSHRRMRYVYPDTPHPAAGWILFWHPEGHWVTLRKATLADREAMDAAVVKAHHAEECRCSLDGCSVTTCGCYCHSITTAEF